MSKSKQPHDKENMNQHDIEQHTSAGLTEDGLVTLGNMVAVPNIWSQPPVSVRPEQFLGTWGIAKIITPDANPEYFGYHFVGRNLRDYDGAVSSKIKKFDPKTMRGVTISGRVYQLVGLPGPDAEAEYVLTSWLQWNGVEAEDGTADFIEHYGISLKDIEKLSE